MERGSVELVYFDGCPNAEAARSNIRGAFEEIGAEPQRNLSTTMGHSTGLIREQCPVW